MQAAAAADAGARHCGARRLPGVSRSVGEHEIGIGRLGTGPPLHGQPQRPATGHRIELCVYVDAVDAIVVRMKAAAVPVLLGPTDQPWGERIAFVADPDGNLVMLAQASSAG